MTNVTETQKKLLAELHERWPGAETTWDETRGVCARVRFAAEARPAEPKGFMTVFGPLFGPENVLELSHEQAERKDELGMRHRRFWLGVPVAGEVAELYGAKLLLHESPRGEVVEAQSGLWRDVAVDEEPRVKAEDIGRILAERLGRAGTKALRGSLSKEEHATFPLATKPRLVVFAWQGSFRISWMAVAWGTFRDEAEGRLDGSAREELDIGPAFVDAVTGEVFFHSRGARGAETPDTGSGTRVTPLVGGFGTRPLNIVRVDATSTYRLKDTTRARTLVTYDAGGLATYGSDVTLGNAIVAGTLAVSEDTDGDRTWNVLPADTTTAERTKSQQAEVDLHGFMGDVYDWYAAIGGRAGWDNGEFSNPPVANTTMHAVAHVPGGINAGMRSTWSGGNVTYWLKFYDGDGTTYSYLAGSGWLVAHEYQHAITEFSFEDAAGNPGVTYDGGWMGALHEGLSDVFAQLYDTDVEIGSDISPNDQIFRNILFPRDDGPPPVTAAYDGSKNDHWADRNTNTERYARGTVLAHCAYLMASGGVHQRTGRAPDLIPVYSPGRETAGGRSVYKAARIWYRALHTYFGTVAAPTGDPASDQNLFINFRTACLSAVADLYPGDTPERAATRLAFYAVGMQPAATPYGADCTFLRWRASWPWSAPYIGIPSPMWSSVDLFVNNGGTSEWNAQVNVDTATGPTQFENLVYCRVRNVGDVGATDVTVQFFYAKIGTASSGWLPMTDKDGIAQTLTLGPLAAGTATFPDAQQNTPPANARVKWYIPPIPAGETVDHYCIRAVVGSTNDVNAHNNDVQSNIAYALAPSAGAFSMNFVARNPGQEAIPADLRVTSTLPRGWKAAISGIERKEWLKPGEERVAKVSIAGPPGGWLPLAPPFDGVVEGEVYGGWTGTFRGTLMGAGDDPARLRGRLSGEVEDLGLLTGAFVGRLDVRTGAIKGRWEPELRGERKARSLLLRVVGHLRPTRTVDIEQRIEGAPANGVTVQLQVALPGDNRSLLARQTGTRTRTRRPRFGK